MQPVRVITQTESWAKEAQPILIDLLEEWLRMARSGELVAACLAGESVDGMTVTGFSHARRRGLLIGALARMQHRLLTDIEAE